jgi:hypothetical protein
VRLPPSAALARRMGVSDADANHAAVRILAHTGTAAGLLTKHHDNAGRCAGCVTPTLWPCELARLCHEAAAPRTRWSRWCRALKPPVVGDRPRRRG